MQVMWIALVKRQRQLRTFEKREFASSEFSPLRRCGMWQPTKPDKRGEDILAGQKFELFLRCTIESVGI